MADFIVRSDSVSVEQIMDQIRTRIAEKRGVDYTEDEVRRLATVKLETFLDPTKARSDLSRALPATTPGRAADRGQLAAASTTSSGRRRPTTSRTRRFTARRGVSSGE